MTEFTDTLLHSERSITELCMDLAFLVAESRSKDPRTKVGACVYDTQTGSFHIGYNGFPSRIADTRLHWENREEKHKRVRHGEEGAVVKALRAGADMERCVLYVTHHPCHRCMGFLIACGIMDVRYAQVYPEDPLTEELAAEAGVRLRFAPRRATAAMALLARAAAALGTEHALHADIESYLNKNGLTGAPRHA